MASFSSPNSLPFSTSPNFNPSSPHRSPPALVCPEPAASSLYHMLGLPPTATRHEIKAAYRRLARVSHPDVNQNQNQYQFVSSDEEFARINAGYDATLSDPGKRADYDKESSMRRKAAPLSCRSRYGIRASRSWETDQCW
uniref:J domain-containing protein n=1 Tax=Kalanchoe fedtschenkoi TaxID=63787 RepID=A0A7N0T0C1_KALFE